MTREDVIGWLEFLSKQEHVKADGIVPCDTEIALGMAIEALKQPEWIPVSERLPDNADKPGTLCEKVRVLTPWGETIGWFNPDFHAWFLVDWFLEDDVRDFVKGDKPIISYTPRGSAMITHWMPMEEI